MLLALGLGDPRLWAAILAHVQPEWCGYGLAGRVLQFAKTHLAGGTSVGLAEVLSGMSGLTEQDREHLTERRRGFPGDATLEYWTGRVAQAHARQKLQEFGRQLWRRAGDPKVPVQDTATAAAREIAEVMAPQAAPLVLSPQQWVSGWRDEAEKRMAARDRGGVFIPTGIPVLDGDVGVERGDLVVLAAQTGVGKTAFGLSVAQAAADADHRVLYANTEMAAHQLANRILAKQALVPVADQRSGRLEPEQFQRLKAATDRLVQQDRLYLTEPLVNVDYGQFAIIVRAHAATKGLDVLVLDYVGRLDNTPAAGEQREYQVLERIARGLKGLAQELQVAVYLLVQRTEDGHLAGSRRMRNEADLVLEIQLVEAQNADQWPECTHLIGVTKARSAAGNRVIGVSFDREHMGWRQVMVR